MDLAEQLLMVTGAEFSIVYDSVLGLGVIPDPSLFSKIGMEEAI